MLELWKPITGYELVYEVSTLGRVRSLARVVLRGHIKVSIKTRFMKLQSDKDGYVMVCLHKEGHSLTCKVHKLVALHFLPPSELSEVNHLNLDKKDNRVGNLEWSTRQANQQHANANGKFGGHNNPNCRQKLTPEIVYSIKEYRAGGATYKDTASKFGISKSMARFVVTDKRWAVASPIKAVGTLF